MLREPIRHIRSRSILLRKCGAPGFAQVVHKFVNPVLNTYKYENVHIGNTILGLLSTQLMEEQSGRHRQRAKASEIRFAQKSVRYIGS